MVTKELILRRPPLPHVPRPEFRLLYDSGGRGAGSLSCTLNPNQLCTVRSWTAKTTQATRSRCSLASGSLSLQAKPAGRTMFSVISFGDDVHVLWLSRKVALVRHKQIVFAPIMVGLLSQVLRQTTWETESSSIVPLSGTPDGDGIAARLLRRSCIWYDHIPCTHMNRNKRKF